MTDVLIVGNGLAANVLAFQLYLHHVSFKIIGNSSLSNCSRIAGGVWNPMVFKRMTTSWMADLLIPELTAFYRSAETATKQHFLTERRMLRSFQEDQEKNLWLKKAETDAALFLDKTIYSEAGQRFSNFNLSGSYSFVNHCGTLDTKAFIDAINSLFKSDLTEENFDYTVLETDAEHVRYKQFTARDIVFCEGHLVKHNPFFNWIPLVPAQGEVFTFKTNALLLDNTIFNRNGFIFKTAAETYRCGATYNWSHLNDEITEGGEKALWDKLRSMLTITPEITEHATGVRPSSKDRRPIIGPHPVQKRVHIFNGLGSKGVMLAPYFSKNFVHFLLNKTTVHADVSVERFYNLYPSVL
ncbi:MAG: FAD-binding oxidoreductase [Sediminibacterium sp.]|nr:FAD-binding oxidoreductase [Sediminibacterium sp.]